MKRYVQQKTVKTVDDEELTHIIVYESKVEDYDYLIFIEK